MTTIALAGRALGLVALVYGESWSICEAAANVDDSLVASAHLYDFLAAIPWWRLEPAHDLIRNQPDDVTRRMVLAKSAAGDLAVAYLPDNEAIEVDPSALPSSLTARWFDPVRGRYTAVAGSVESRGTRRFVPPGKGDWALLLRRQ